MTIPPRLLRSYRDTLYRVGNHDIRIGRRSPLAGVLMTAWNPMSRRMPSGWNHRMQTRLRQRLRRWRVTAGNGGLRAWHEDHLLVTADPRLCRTLARLFRQRSIVVLRPRQPVRLCVLR